MSSEEYEFEGLQSVTSRDLLMLHSSNHIEIPDEAKHIGIPPDPTRDYMVDFDETMHHPPVNAGSYRPGYRPLCVTEQTVFNFNGSRSSSQSTNVSVSNGSTNGPMPNGAPLLQIHNEPMGFPEDSPSDPFQDFQNAVPAPQSGSLLELPNLAGEPPGLFHPEMVFANGEGQIPPAPISPVDSDQFTHASPSDSIQYPATSVSSPAYTHRSPFPLESPDLPFINVSQNVSSPSASASASTSNGHQRSGDDGQELAYEQDVAWQEGRLRIRIRISGRHMDVVNGTIRVVGGNQAQMVTLVVEISSPDQSHLQLPRDIVFFVRLFNEHNDEVQCVYARNGNKAAIQRWHSTTMEPFDPQRPPPHCCFPRYSKLPCVGQSAAKLQLRLNTLTSKMRTKFKIRIYFDNTIPFMETAPLDCMSRPKEDEVSPRLALQAAPPLSAPPTAPPTAAPGTKKARQSKKRPLPAEPIFVESISPVCGPCNPLRPYVSVLLKGISPDWVESSQPTAASRRNGVYLANTNRNSVANSWTATFVDRRGITAGVLAFPSPQGEDSLLQYLPDSGKTMLSGRVPLLEPGAYHVEVRVPGDAATLQPVLRFTAGQLSFAQPGQRARIPGYHVSFKFSSNPFGGLVDQFIRLFLSDGRVVDVVSTSELVLAFDHLGPYIAAAETLFDEAPILFESAGRVEAYDDMNRVFAYVDANRQLQWLPTAVDLKQVRRGVRLETCPISISTTPCSYIITPLLYFTLIEDTRHKETGDSTTRTPFSPDPALLDKIEAQRRLIEQLAQRLSMAELQSPQGSTSSGGFSPQQRARADILESLLGLVEGGPMEPLVVGFVDNAGNNMLAIAAAIGSADLVRKILFNGVDPMHRNSQGRTAAHVAALYHFVDVLDLLYAVHVSFLTQDLSGLSVADLFPDYYRLGLPRTDPLPVVSLPSSRSQSLPSTDSDAYSDSEDDSERECEVCESDCRCDSECSEDDGPGEDPDAHVAPGDSGDCPVATNAAVPQRQSLSCSLAQLRLDSPAATATTWTGAIACLSCTDVVKTGGAGATVGVVGGEPVRALTLTDLPMEILLCILSLLNIFDLRRVNLVSKYLHRHAKPILATRHVFQDLPSKVLTNILGNLRSFELCAPRGVCKLLAHTVAHDIECRPLETVSALAGEFTHLYSRADRHVVYSWLLDNVLSPKVSNEYWDKFATTASGHDRALEELLRLTPAMVAQTELMWQRLSFVADKNERVVRWSDVTPHIEAAFRELDLRRDLQNARTIALGTPTAPDLLPENMFRTMWSWVFFARNTFKQTRELWTGPQPIVYPLMTRKEAETALASLGSPGAYVARMSSVGWPEVSAGAIAVSVLAENKADVTHHLLSRADCASAKSLKAFLELHRHAFRRSFASYIPPPPARKAALSAPPGPIPIPPPIWVTPQAAASPVQAVAAAVPSPASTTTTLTPSPSTCFGSPFNSTPVSSPATAQYIGPVPAQAAAPATPPPAPTTTPLTPSPCSPPVGYNPRFGSPFNSTPISSGPSTGQYIGQVPRLQQQPKNGHSGPHTPSPTPFQGTPLSSASSRSDHSPFEGSD